MRRVVTGLLALGAAALAHPASAETWALFVGIGEYASPNVTKLTAPAADVATVKPALTKRFGLKPEESLQTTTLLDSQATRAAILGELDRKIASSKPGDQLLFYYSGHGGRVYRNDAFSDETDRHDETLVAHDARTPGGKLGDIIDDELRVRFTQANAKGVSVVTIFDSCNSGSATRGPPGAPVAKAVSPLAAPLPPEQLQEVLAIQRAAPPPAPSFAGGVFNVHVAAARDDEEAWEGDVGGARRSLFTVALARVLEGQPEGANYQDVMNATLDELETLRGAAGVRAQHPRVEGDTLRAFGGASPAERRVFRAVRTATGYQLEGGAIQAVGEGAALALYPTATAAAAGVGAPLTSATVDSVTPARAMLKLSGGGDFGEELYARETGRVFPRGLVRVQLKGDDAAVAAVRARLAALDAVDLTDTAPDYVFEASGDRVRIVDELGSERAVVGIAAVERAARMIAHYQSLLALGASRASPAVDLQLVSCDGDPCRSTPLARSAGEYRLKPSSAFWPEIRNTSASTRYVYLLLLAADFSVIPVYPPVSDASGVDNGLQASKTITPFALNTDKKPGRDRLVLISTDQPVNLRALEQGAINWDTSRATRSRGGTRGSQAPDVKEWGVVVRTAVTEAQ